MLKRKSRMTIEVVVGMLESSAQLDNSAAERRKIGSRGFLESQEDFNETWMESQESQ